MFEVDPLILEHMRPLLYLYEDVPDVLADDAKEQHLHRSQEEHTNHQGRHAHRKLLPEKNLVQKITDSCDERNRSSNKSSESRKSQRNLRQRCQAKNPNVIQREQIG